MNALRPLPLPVLEGIAGIDVLVVFGSRAGGRPRPDSDLDVAVITSESRPEGRRRLQTALAVALADCSPDGRVDVVFVDEAPTLLRQRIMESGRIVICRDPALWRRWRVRTMREYGDGEHWRELLRRALRARLEGERKGGRSGRALESLERTRKLPH